MTSPLIRVLQNKYTAVHQAYDPFDNKKYWIPEIFVSTQTNNTIVCRYKTTKTPGDCNQQLIEWKDEDNRYLKKYKSLYPTYIPNFDRTMLICANPKCSGRVDTDATKVDGNQIHVGCYFRFVRKEKKEHATIYEYEDEEKKKIRKQFIIPGCSKICMKAVNSYINGYYKKVISETQRVKKIQGCINNQSWNNLPKANKDNVTKDGRTTQEIVLDWFTKQENCNKYLGASDDATKKISGMTRDALCLQVCNIIRDEIGEFITCTFHFKM